MNARNGKIARLPRCLRDELNQRLECSEESPQLLDWLNALPQVKKVVRETFAGAPISKQNLSQWRQGGFQEWLARRDLFEDTRNVTELVEDMQFEYAEGVLADDVAMVLAARLGSMITNWNGEVDEKFKARADVLNRIGRTVVQLQRGMHRSNRETFELQRLHEEKETAEKEALKHKLMERVFDALKEPVLAKMFGCGEAGRKVAECILAIQRGNFDGLDLPPINPDNEKSAAKEPKPVKPAPKPRTVKRPKKTRQHKAPKPLKENEMDGAKDEESSQAQSKSVKVGQPDLAAAGEEGLGTDEAAREPQPLVPSFPSIPSS